MTGKVQLSPRLQRRPYRLSTSLLPNVRLAGAIALGLALAYAPGVLHARGANQDTVAAPQTHVTDKSPDGKPVDKAKAGAQKKATNVAGVTVTGLRASIESSESLKRNASQIVDSVTAANINSMPDRTVTEVLQRISGVTVDHFLADTDPDHPSAEGSGVLIRGLPYVKSLLNGNTSFSANNGRSLSFEDVPAELMQGVDVYKNPSAELIEGGIGGTVNLRTRMPFDNPGQVTAFSFGINEGDRSVKTRPSTSFLWSNRWKTENLGEFGLLFDVSDSELASRSVGIQTNPFLLEPADNLGACPCEPNPGDHNVAVPGDLNWRQMDMKRRRIGLYGALQWRPTSSLEIYSRFLRSNYNLRWNEHNVQTNESNYYNMVPVPGTAFSYDGNGVFQNGTMVSNAWKGAPSAAPLLVPGSAWPPIGNTEYYAQNRVNTQFTRTTDWTSGFKFNVNDHVLLSGSLQFVRSIADSLDFSVYNQFYMAPATVDLSGSVPGLTLTNPTYQYLPRPDSPGDPSSLTNPANYYVGAAMDHLQHDWAMDRAARLDMEYYFDDSDWLQYFKVGVRSTNYDAHSNNTNSSYNWGAISQVWMGDYTGPSSLAWANNLPSWMEEQFKFSNFIGGSTVPTRLWFPSNELVGNYRKAIPALQAIAMSGGWCPQFTKDGSCTPGSAMSDNHMHQQTQAAYAMLFFGNDSALGIPFDGNIGVRFVHTGTRSNGSVTFPTSTAITGNASSITPAQMALFNGANEAIDGRASYNNVLPSLNLRFKLTHDLQFRLAASKAISRPPVSQLNSYMKIGTSWSATQTGQQASFAGFTASTGGNPDLRPMEANQFDAALEWYWAPTSELYVTLFKKNISNYINTITHVQTIKGQPIAVTGPENSGSGIVKGAEVGYSQFFDFLPGPLKGLGVKVNYTFLQSSKLSGSSSCDPNHPNGSCDTSDVVTNPPLPMQGLSHHNYNVTGMYEYGNWSARLAWSWRSRYLIASQDSGDTYLPVWDAGSGRLDSTVFYHINKSMQVGLRMNNLTNTTTRVLMGPTTYTNGYVDHSLYTRSVFREDRRYELVFRATFQ